MMQDNLRDLGRFVEPDRVHRTLYTDPAIFEREMATIFHKVWTYVGHESQVPKPGDYHTLLIGRQPMVMVRHSDNRIYVLYNRCAHRGAMVCGALHGNTGSTFTCSYHSWQYRTDGTLESIPLPKGYEGTRLSPGSPEFNIKRAARVDSYRGFYFASLAAEGPSLLEYLGDAKIAFDDMCNRAPEGEVEVVPNCFRVIQHSNWKIFLENQLDALHPSVTHESTGRAALEVEHDIEKRNGKAPLDYHYLSAFTTPFHKWDTVQTVNYPNGHCILQGYMGLRPQDPDTLAYEAVMRKHYGEKRTEEILGVNIHHVLLYPGLSVQSPLQQLRAVRPLSVDRTLTEIWHFRLKGAPEAIYRRALGYYNLVNSPSTMVNADDLENFWRCHQGLASEGGDWVSFHRHAGQDDEKDGVILSRWGTSEAPMRNQFRAWTHYVAGGR
ncbi:MAG TPA: Rieske 2Fe-2S domain-containing protein [Stellaceae bacterium]|jgi:phenylpropionate dioxygenase-like ring-hydroxylating dioxygenase large terminal subunit|nr:Rieske 2Fe-2S domain-containing protein [Stellaceae bacterium]